MTEILEAEIAAAIRKYIDEHGVLYYQHATGLATAVMVPVGFALAQVGPQEQAAEMVSKTVAQQNAKLMAYKILKAQGLPIPPDLKAEIEDNDEPEDPEPEAPPVPDKPTPNKPKPKRTSRKKKKDDDAGTGDRSGG